jgi:hypothetical protein
MRPPRLRARTAAGNALSRDLRAARRQLLLFPAYRGSNRFVDRASAEATGLMVTPTRAGFGTGLLFILPLGRLNENRRLVVILVGIAAVALLTAALSSGNLPSYRCAHRLVSVAVQLLLAFAAHHAPDPIKGRVAGNVTSGLIIIIRLTGSAAPSVTQVERSGM